MAACRDKEPVALLVGAFPPAYVWPCEAACRKEDGKIRESTGGCPWCLFPWWIVDSGARKLWSKQGKGMSALVLTTYMLCLMQGNGY